MGTESAAIVAMATECRSLIQASDKTTALDLPNALRPKHLLWMCNKIEQHAQDWPATKLHRWIGFVQCAMMANQMLDLSGAKAMFEQVKNAHGGIAQDQDLIDHLDVETSFEFEIGGQG